MSSSTSSSDEAPKQPRYDTNPVPKKIIRSFFEKRSKYKKCPEWILPENQVLFTEDYKIESLQTLKLELNEVKSKLNDYPIEQWSAHTRKRNPSGEVAWRLKSHIDAEFVTQAWCKFYECLHQFPIVSDGTVNSVHLCEAPGAFIAALNHYLHSTYKSVKWQWLSSTLNPYYEGNPLGNMVIDDRFMLHTLENWIFGKDFTGNILNKENIENMAEKAEKLGPIHLITADGSIDCMQTPECQEEVVSKLHYAETCAALRMLSDGGCFVIKMFTLYEATTVSLLYLLNYLFMEVNIFKPATSKCGNSEVYVVCLNLQRSNPLFSNIYKAMLNELENTNHKPIFPLTSLPESFLRQHEMCARKFMNYQIKVIEGNIKSFGSRSIAAAARGKLLRTHVANFYFKRYKIQKIREEDKILYIKKAAVQYAFHSRIYTGSFTERLSLQHKSAKEKLAYLHGDLEDLERELIWPNSSNTYHLQNSDQPKEICLYTGKPITDIYSSLFIEIHLMHLINKVLNIINTDQMLSFSIVATIESDANEIFNIPIADDEKLSLRGQYYQQERNFIRKIIQYIIGKNAKNLILQGVPFLTHFSVAFLMLMSSNVFTNVILSKEHTITFNEMQSDGIKFLQRIQNVIENNNESILCLVNIKELHGNSLSEAVTCYNNILCLSYCRALLES